MIQYVSNNQCDSRSTELKDVHSYVGKLTKQGEKSRVTKTKRLIKHLVAKRQL